MMRCYACNRVLTNPKSVQMGIGPICARKRKLQEERQMTCEFSDSHIGAPITDGLMMRRVDGVVYTNVPHFAVWHSPNGYEFGYGGSGPADLALNACEWMLRHLGYAGYLVDVWRGNRIFYLAVQLHQDFKWKFIATVEREAGSTLSYATWRQWTEEQIAAQPKQMEMWDEGD